MKIALAQLNYHTGNFVKNTDKIINKTREAKEKGADLVVFSELAICGYPPRDFLEFRDFLAKCDESVKKIAGEARGIGVIIGVPVLNPKIEGKDLFNAAIFIEDGEIKHTSCKALLPTYDIFDENRYFEPGTSFKTFTYKGKKIALTVCEDIWNINQNPLYTMCPMDELKKENPDIAINIAASPYSFRHDEERKKVLYNNAKKYGIPFFYVNNIGAQTELIFDGGSCVVNRNGNVCGQLAFFEEDLRIYDVAELDCPKDVIVHDPEKKIPNIKKALVLGIRDYFGKLGFKKAILGLSGGIDSAVVCALAAEALGPENVLAVLMPTNFTSQSSIDDALELSKNLGTPFKNIGIQSIFETFLENLDPYFEGRSPDITEENLQARSRAVILMALANKFGYILLNTSNKSELAVGYGTLYGDMCGGISVLGDLYKSEIFELAREINRNGELIPENIITKPPSAELKENQKDTDTLPPYDVLDTILFHYIEQRKGPKELVEMGFEENLVKRILKMVNTNEYKRAQAPPILRVSDKAFGMGRRLPIVAKYLN